MIPHLNFTEAQSTAANEAWGANCGPHALAAALDIGLEFARALMPGFEARGFTNPTMMGIALTIGMAGKGFQLDKNLYTSELREGICRVQWEGPWLRHPMASYAHTHWIAVVGDYVYCTACGFGWQSQELWRLQIAKLCRENGYDGWHITHRYQFPSPAGGDF